MLESYISFLNYTSTKINNNDNIKKQEHTTNNVEISGGFMY